MKCLMAAVVGILGSVSAAEWDSTRGDCPFTRPCIEAAYDGHSSPVEACRATFAEIPRSAAELCESKEAEVKGCPDGGCDDAMALEVCDCSSVESPFEPPWKCNVMWRCREERMGDQPGYSAPPPADSFRRSARAQRNTGGEPQVLSDGRLTGLIGAFVPRKGDEPTPSSAPYEATGDDDHYLAVATSPPTGWRIEPGDPGYFGFGWHAGSGHEAGTAAAAECRRQSGGSACGFKASGTSMPGGCVGLAIANWRDRGEAPARTYVVATSSFRNRIDGELRAGCDGATFPGKHEDTVVEHSCDIVRTMCAEDAAAAVTPPR